MCVFNNWQLASLVYQKEWMGPAVVTSELPMAQLPVQQKTTPESEITKQVGGIKWLFQPPMKAPHAKWGPKSKKRLRGAK